MGILILAVVEGPVLWVSADNSTTYFASGEKIPLCL